jgi:tRNA-dihydrouridine synthase 3
MTLAEQLHGALVMAPMTKGSNLPYRRLCVELGARVAVSEMTVARRLKQRRKGEFALVRRAPDVPCFGVQLAGTNPEEMAWAAALVESRGADFVDVNLGCPIASRPPGTRLARSSRPCPCPSSATATCCFRTRSPPPTLARAAPR